MTVAADQPFIIFGSPLIEQAEIDEVVACMQSSWLGTGPRVAQFEQDFAAYQKLEAAQVVEQDTQRVELYRRDNDWQVEYFEDGDIPLDCLDMALPVADVYVDLRAFDVGGG